MDWTGGLDYWTGGLDYWTGGLDYDWWTNLTTKMKFLCRFTPDYSNSLNYSVHSEFWLGRDQ